MAVAADAHIAGRYADDFPLLADEKLGRCEPGIDFPAPRRAQPSAQLRRASRQNGAGRPNRHRPIGQSHRRLFSKKIELIGRDLSLERAPPDRSASLASIGQARSDRSPLPRGCAPTVEPFSTTTTETFGSNDFSRMAAARPAGPAPTITTSYSIDFVGLAVWDRQPLSPSPSRPMSGKPFALEHLLFDRADNPAGDPAQDGL